MNQTNPINRVNRRDQMTEIKEAQIRPILKLVTQIMRRHLPETSHRILLFGSWATLESTARSDIDIAILGEAPVDELIMAQIKEEIDRLPTLRKVEVVDLWVVEDRFRNKVEQQAEILS
jgi:predicted nucleotidyltransferase